MATNFSLSVVRSSGRRGDTAAPMSLSLEEMIRSSSMAPWRQSRKRAREEGDSAPPRCCVHCRELGICAKQVEDPETSDEVKAQLWELLARELPNDKHLCDKKQSPDIQALIQTAMRTLQQQIHPRRLEAVKVLTVLVRFRSNHRAFAKDGGHLELVSLLAHESLKHMMKALARCITGLVRTDPSYYSDIINGRVKSLIANATMRQDRTPIYVQNFVRLYHPTLKRIYVGVPRGVSKVMLARDLMKVFQEGNEMAKYVAIVYFHVALGLTDSLSDGDGDAIPVTLARKTLTINYVLRESVEDVVALAVDSKLPRCQRLARNILVALATSYPGTRDTIRAHQLLYDHDLLPLGV